MSLDCLLLGQRSKTSHNRLRFAPQVWCAILSRSIVYSSAFIAPCPSHDCVHLLLLQQVLNHVLSRYSRTGFCSGMIASAQQWRSGLPSTPRLVGLAAPGLVAVTLEEVFRSPATGELCTIKGCTCTTEDIDHGLGAQGCRLYGVHCPTGTVATVAATAHSYGRRGCGSRAHPAERRLVRVKNRGLLYSTL